MLFSFCFVFLILRRIGKNKLFFYTNATASTVAVLQQQNSCERQTTHAPMLRPPCDPSNGGGEEDAFHTTTLYNSTVVSIYGRHFPIPHRKH